MSPRDSSNSQNLNPSGVQLHDMANWVSPNHPPELLIRHRLGHDALIQPLLDSLPILDPLPLITAPQHHNPTRRTQRASRQLPHRLLRPSLLLHNRTALLSPQRDLARLRHNPPPLPLPLSLPLPIPLPLLPTPLLPQTRRRRRQQLQQRLHIRLIRPRNRIPLVHKRQKQTLPQLSPLRPLQRQQAHRRRPKRHAMHPLKTPRQHIQLALRRLARRQHVRIQQARHRPARRVPRDQQRVPAARGVLLEQLAQSRRDGLDHAPRDGQEARVAEVARVVEEVRGRRVRRVEVDGPVHEGRGAADREDDGVHVVHGHGLDHHGLGAVLPVRVDVGVALGALGGLVDALGVLGGHAEERPGGHVSGIVSGLVWLCEGGALTVGEAGGSGAASRWRTCPL